MTVWLLADSHFGHARVAELRGFASAEEHDATLMRNFGRRFQSDDEVWWLGDVAMGDWRANLRNVSQLPGTHHLVMGNHDRCAPNNTRGWAYQHDFRVYGDFASIQQFARLNYQGRRLLLSHYPYSGDHTEGERFTQFRLRDEGLILVHGHSHSTEKFSRSAAGSPQVCVSLDAWGFKPPSLYDVMVVLSENGVKL